MTDPQEFANGGWLPPGWVWDPPPCEQVVDREGRVVAIIGPDDDEEGEQ